MYEQVVSFFEAHKKILLTILIYIVCFSIIFLAGYNIGIGVLSGNGAGINAARNQLKSIEAGEHKSNDLIKQGSKQNNSVRQSITDSINTEQGIRDDISNAQNSVRHQNNAITSSEEIFRRVRQRGKEEIPGR